jgi:arabinogalactan oligomer/maltooligosaccharide transport system permease protein
VARSPSHRARFAAGLAAGLVVGVGLSWLWARGAVDAAAEARDRREAVADLVVLTDLVHRAGTDGDALRAAVAAWQARTPPPSAVRVVLLQGIRLEASTDPRDSGERAAPRRLGREEKPLFDRAQRLRAAVEGNRAGGASRPEVEVRPLGEGRLSLAAPLERDGAVVGMVELDAPPGAGVPPSPVLGAFLAVALPLLAFVVALGAGGRRALLGTTALAALLAGLGGFGGHALREAAHARRRAHAAVAAHAGSLSAEEAGLLDRLRLPAPALRPGDLDVDPWRRPMGFVTAEGGADEARAGPDSEAAARDGAWALGGAVLVALATLAVIGLGGASRVVRALAHNRQAYVYTLPAMIGMLVLVFFPFAYGILLSFTDSNIYNTSAPLSELWLGLRNYGAILSDLGIVRHAADGSLVFNYQNFYWTLAFTVLWTVSNVAVGVSLGLALALTLNVKGLALRSIYRVVLILPWAVPNYITALVWRGMFHQQFGVVNQLRAIVGLEPIAWFERPLTSFATVLATNGWLSFPFMMVVSLGALQSIPADLYEAARVDGASRWQQFRAITLPSLRPALVPAVILSVVWTFNMFNIPYLVSGGEPGGATEILVTQAYKFAFERYRYGYAAAYATIIFAILFVYGVFQNRVTRATEGI